MSMVNADSVQLFAMLKKMQDSISSIETTKKSVKMKYEQLGAGWQDKKYNELGVVVRDCNKALNDILVIMLQAEKYVALLAKSLSEYESVQLGSTIIIYIKKRNDDMDEDNIITLNDENGNEVEFEFLDLIPYRQNEYVVLLPIGDSDGQVVILQLKEIDDETEEYVGVENEFVLETVFALFKERNKDFFTFE